MLLKPVPLRSLLKNWDYWIAWLILLASVFGWPVLVILGIAPIY